MAWIPVPNVVGLMSWMVEMCSIKMWEECTTDFKCRTNHLPSLLVQPLQFELAKVEEEAELARLHYWGSILMLSPVLMAMICEFMRLVFSCAKGMSDVLAKQPTSRSPRYSRLVRTEEEADLESPSVQAKEPDRICSILFPLIVYHVTCAGIVALAMFKGWLSIDGGGLPLELWVLWQQLCLWNLFLQNLVRCVMLDSDALKASTFSVVLVYTAPFVSELADTMKDWVVTGICILHAETWIGFVIGAAIFGMEATAIVIGLIPDLYLSYSVILLLALYAALLLARFHLWLLILGAIPALAAMLWKAGSNKSDFRPSGAAEEKALPLPSWCGPILFVGSFFCFLIPDHLRQIDTLCQNWAPTVFRCLADGGLLASVSIYVILNSHIHIFENEDCVRDLRKRYRAILELPLKPTNTDRETCCEWMGSRISNLCVDFLSSARLVIAWSEDIPQGLIGVVLVLRYAGRNGIGFAGISATISILKGILIPAGQQVMLRFHRAEFQRGLEDIMEQQETLAERLQGPPLNHQSLQIAVADLLQEESEDLLESVGKSDQSMRDTRIKWLRDAGEKLRCHVVTGYFKEGFSAQELFDLGHMTGNCKDAGFSAKQCKEVASFSAKQCKEAQFSAKDLKDAGFSVIQCRIVGFEDAACKEAGFPQELSREVNAHDYKDAGMSAIDCSKKGFSAQECKEADFPASEMKTAFSVQLLRELGFSAKQCKEAGCSAKECKEAEFSVKEFKDAGFSAVQCKIVGFEATACQEAGYSTEEWTRKITARDYRDTGLSCIDCHDVGFSAKQCKEAGFSLEEIQDAGFSDQQLRRSGFVEEPRGPRG